MKEVSTRSARHYVVHWISKKHWSKPGFVHETSDVPTVARRHPTLDEAVARAKSEIASGAVVRNHVEIFGIDRGGCAVALYWIKHDGSVGGMDMDG